MCRRLIIIVSFDDFSLSTKPSEYVIIHWCELVAMKPKAQISATPTTKLTAKPLTKPTKSSKMNPFAKWNSWRNATMSQVIFFKKCIVGKLGCKKGRQIFLYYFFIRLGSLRKKNEILRPDETNNVYTNICIIWDIYYRVRKKTSWYKTHKFNLKFLYFLKTKFSEDHNVFVREFLN